MSAPAQNQATASSSSTSNGVAPQAEKKPLEQLGALEEDDEFEEFPAEDWPESSTTLAALTAQAKAKASNSGSNNGAGGQVASDPSLQLWEDNWDDDDKEPAFTNQLRAELKKQSDANAMQT